MDIQFEGFGKIPRLSRQCVITEKIDGTNAQVHIMPLSSSTNIIEDFKEKGWAVLKSGMFYYGIVPASRKRHITPNKDNFGFARWVFDNAEELLKLGPGRHFGEWWGQGIQRKYGMDKKVFSLFNINKWSDDDVRPKCCSVVPILYEGPFDTQKIESVLEELSLKGSKAASGFNDPEGIIIYHCADGKMFKKTIKDDEAPKSLK